MLSVTYFYREPRKTGLSIEGIFRLVKKDLAGKVAITEYYCDANLSRVQNTRLAGKRAGAINHITGDVNFLAMAMKSRKNILTVHDLGHYDTLKKRGYLQFFVYKLFWFRLPLKNVTQVTVVSEFTKRKLMEYFAYPENKIRVIPDPVKPIFAYREKDRMSNKPRVLMMGTGKHKNLGGLIEAARGLDVHLDIIGWPSEDELAKLRDYGIEHAIYNGLTDEQVYERYVACDIMYNASFYEGFGMPIIEAQSVGRPVITSDLGAMKEVAKQSAVLVDPYKSEEISAAIHRLVDDRAYYDKMVALGRENVKPYDHKAIAQQYLKVYEELA
jgi:glycosyltransferase involved in cell wall biosynthesis